MEPSSSSPEPIGAPITNNSARGAGGGPGSPASEAYSISEIEDRAGA